MNNVGLYAFLVVFACLLVLTSSEPIKWRINLPEGTHNQQVQTSTGTSFSFSLPNTNDIDQSKIRLVDWREWSRMRPSYSATIGAPPLLIVDTDSMIDEKHKSTIPEAMLEEPETTTLNEETIETTTSIETTTTPAPQTTSSPETSTLDDQSLSTTPKPNPDVTLELRNLPDILALLKHLSLIPAVVRSFSSAAMPTSASQDGLPATASNPLSSLIAAASSNSQPNSDLRSRALSANSGYNARSPQFVTATPVESELPQII
ncbi:hypothetical protein M3Y97_01061100 [Aphelenchoides bicaudatus]|nr:hypothetical protein M3Y97_01061100 [Aphelenchoides bicaudatus]